MEHYNWSDIEDDVRMFAYSLGICARKTPFDDCRTMYSLPVTLFPTEIDKHCFNLAYNLQSIINELIYKLSIDHRFLEDSLKSLHDDFVKRLFDIYETVRKEGYAAKHQLGIFRSDYMIDVNKQLKQVETNTISSAFVALAPRVEQFHRYTLKQYRQMTDEQIDECLPRNTSLDDMVQSLIDAHDIYMKSEPNCSICSILFVIQEQESNIMDQKLIEFCLKTKRSDIKVYRRTFNQLDGKIFLGPNKQLMLTIPNEYNNLLIRQRTEISVVYYRTAYTTNNYSNENSWKVRLLLEQSRAIKCPSIQYQLAGFKQFQTLLSNPNIFNRYVDSNFYDKWQQLYETYTKFWIITERTRVMVNENPENYVLKSNQEGGGNNIFGKEIPGKIDDIFNNGQNDAYFLMEFIQQKPTDSLVIFKQSTSDQGFKYYSIDSELGMYGTILANNQSIVFNRNAGYLLRSKICGQHEAGIVSAGGILDTPFLTDQ